MKISRVLAEVFVLAILFASLLDVGAGYGGRRRAYNYYPPDTAPPQLPPDQTDPSRPAQPKQPKPPAEKQEKFKDVPLNTTFYFAVDHNKTFPRIKISDTTARNVKDGKVSAVPAATLVVVGSETHKTVATPKK